MEDAGLAPGKGDTRSRSRSKVRQPEAAPARSRSRQPEATPARSKSRGRAPVEEPLPIIGKPGAKGKKGGKKGMDEEEEDGMLTCPIDRDFWLTWHRGDECGCSPEGR